MRKLGGVLIVGVIFGIVLGIILSANNYYYAAPHEIITIHYKPEEETYWYTIEKYKIEGAELTFCGVSSEGVEGCHTATIDEIPHFSIRRPIIGELLGD